ncbi:hypothetical protein DYB38_003539 [Aphanomyces astaci]|uniref:Uncharacterized protein n=1 Tax=Aphanomyces astaci TaxID=112090 RepID=A0A397CXU4_APHAT|nr:hypothetical protein DYB38_003539 [Aphanomyces astaci]
MASKRIGPGSAALVVAAAGIVGLAAFLALKVLDQSPKTNKDDNSRSLSSPTTSPKHVTSKAIALSPKAKAPSPLPSPKAKIPSPPPSPKQVAVTKAKAPSPLPSPKAKIPSPPPSPKQAAVAIESAYLAHKSSPPASPKRLPAKQPASPVSSPAQTRKSSTPPTLDTQAEAVGVIEAAYIAHKTSPTHSPAPSPKKPTPTSSPKKQPTPPVSSPVQINRKGSPQPDSDQVEAASVIEAAYIAHKSSPKASPKSVTPVVSSPKPSTPVVSSPKKIARKGSLPPTSPSIEDVEAAQVIESDEASPSKALTIVTDDDEDTSAALQTSVTSDGYVDLEPSDNLVTDVQNDEAAPAASPDASKKNKKKNKKKGKK